MKKIGLTGGIGAGKTFVSQLFIDMGIPVYVSDVKAKELMVKDQNVISQVKSLFGEEAYLNGKLNRPFIAFKAFNDNSLLQKLNNIVHPVVARDFELWYSKQNAKYVIKEAAIIFENNLQNELDEVIVVSADETERVKRVMSRDGIEEGPVRDRIANQMPQEEKEALADYVILNNGEDLNEQVQIINDYVINGKPEPEVEEVEEEVETELVMEEGQEEATEEQVEE